MSSTVNQQNSSFSMSEEEEAFGYAWCLRSSVVFPFVLNGVIQLGVFDILAKAGPDARMSCNEIASQLHSNNPDAPSLLDRMLQLLACYNLVTCNISQNLDDNGNHKVQRLYGLTLPGKAFVHDDNNGSLATAFSITKYNLDVWLHLKDFVLESGKDLFERVHGMSAFKYMSLDPERERKFQTVMTNGSKISVRQVMEKYQGFQGITTLVDVGGRYGTTLNMIISKYPSIKGINFDLPLVIQQAPLYPGIEHIGGDMFLGVPKADAIMLKYVLHNWNDECCLKLLKNCREALPKKGKVIVINYVMFEEPEPSDAAKSISQLDLMMAMQFGTQERTANQFKAMAMAAGFSDFQLNCLILNMIGVMEFYK